LQRPKRQRIIEGLESKDLVNWSAIKGVPRAEMFDVLPAEFGFKTKPWTHQLATFLVSVGCIVETGHGFLNALDMGTGKTKVAIDVCRYVAQRNGNLRALVVCLNSAVEHWADEVEMHSDLTSTCARGSPKQRWAALVDPTAAFSIINFEGLRAMLTVRKKKVRYKSERRTSVDSKLVHQLVTQGRFNFLIVDESHKIKSPRSLNFLVLSTIGQFVRYRLLLTGTPFGNTLLDVWAQYFLMDSGETFGQKFIEFRDDNFEDKGYVSPNTGQHISKWKPTKEGIQRIKAKLFSKAIRYSEDEVEDLPEKVYRQIKFVLGKDQRTEYNRLLSLVSDTGRFLPPDFGFQLRYVCSGFVRHEGDNFTPFRENPKLQALLDVLDNVLIMGKKAVVFYEFRPEGIMLEEAIQKQLKVKLCLLRGGVKDPYLQWKTRFQDDPKYKIMLAQPQSGGESIELTAGNYCLFYSNNRAVIMRRQCEKRLHRGGQEALRTYFYDFIAKASVEVTILNALRSGLDFMDHMLTKRGAQGLPDGRSKAKH